MKTQRWGRALHLQIPSLYVVRPATDRRITCGVFATSIMRLLSLSVTHCSANNKMANNYYIVTFNRPSSLIHTSSCHPCHRNDCDTNNCTFIHGRIACTPIEWSWYVSFSCNAIAPFASKTNIPIGNTHNVPLFCLGISQFVIRISNSTNVQFDSFFFFSTSTVTTKIHLVSSSRYIFLHLSYACCWWHKVSVLLLLVIANIIFHSISDELCGMMIELVCLGKQS